MKTLDEMIAVMQAARAGKTIQHTDADGSSSWSDIPTSCIGWNWHKVDYRIKPEPKRVPLGPEDVPPGSAFRYDSWNGGWTLIRSVSPKKIWLHDVCHTFDDLSQDSDARISRDGGKTWLPCWKEEA